MSDTDSSEGLDEGTDAPAWGTPDAEPDPSWDDAADQEEMAAEDREAHERALEAANPDDITYDKEGNAVLTRDPHDILAGRDKGAAHIPAKRPAGEPPIPRRRDTTGNSTHGQGGPGVGGGKGQRKWRGRAIGSSGRGGGGWSLFHFTFDFSGWFKGWLSPDIDAGNGNGLVTFDGKNGSKSRR